MRLQQYVPLTRSMNAGMDAEPPAGVRSAIETLRPIVVKHGRMGTLSLLAGGFAILKGLASLRSSKGRALRRIAVGAGWIAIGRAQQQASDPAVEVDEPWTSGSENEDSDIDEGNSGVIADANQQEPRDFGDPGEGETPNTDSGAEEAEITGPSSGDAVPETDKEGGPQGMPDDDVEMVDPDPDQAAEGELQAEDSGENDGNEDDEE